MDKDEIRKLADSGDAEAMYQLGLMYESGDGMMQNTSIAVKRFREAADKGHEKAMEKLEQLSHKYKIASYTPTDSKEKKAPPVKALNDPLPQVLNEPSPQVLSEPSPPVLNDPPRSRLMRILGYKGLLESEWYLGLNWKKKALIPIVMFGLLFIAGELTSDKIMPYGFGFFMLMLFLEIVSNFSGKQSQGDEAQLDAQAKELEKK